MNFWKAFDIVLNYSTFYITTSAKLPRGVMRGEPIILPSCGFFITGLLLQITLGGYVVGRSGEDELVCSFVAFRVQCLEGYFIYGTMGHFENFPFTSIVLIIEVILILL